MTARNARHLSMVLLATLVACSDQSQDTAATPAAPPP